MKYYVQVGKGSKGAYKTRYALDNYNQALIYYHGINIGNGYKKRLMEAGNKKPLLVARS